MNSRTLERRVATLEAGGQRNLSPRAKAWLGWPLTATEQTELDADRPTAVEIDVSELSMEAKKWLGLN